MRKTAILFGNNDYENGEEQRLKCSVRDAEDLSKSLEILGFSVALHLNSSRNEMAVSLSHFEEGLSQYDIGLFFFSGHGFQFDGKNYLAPVDASFYDRSSAAYTSFDLDIALQSLCRSSLHTKIFIIDACRTATFPNERGNALGLAPVFAPRGTIIAFGTSPGQVAIERGNYGLYTNAILQHIMTENLSIENMFKRVRNTVYVASDGRQITWEHTSLMGEFYFNNRHVGETNKAMYSMAALADNQYECEKGSVLGGVIANLKTHDYNYQNATISELSRLNLGNETVDDLFVLGRNLYQSSSNAYSVMHYFEKLEINLSRYIFTISKHILNGMAYEIYFDSNGKLRKHLKIHQFEEVYNNLIKPANSECCSFMLSQLQNYTQKILFTPGSVNKIHFDIIARKNPEGEGYYLDEIALDGQSVLYNDEGTEIYENSLDNSRVCSPEEVKESLCGEIGCLRNDIEISWVYDIDIDPAAKKVICVPFRYVLLRYAN